MKKEFTIKEIAAELDHSLLRPQMSVDEVTEGCLLAKELGCVTVCVKPCDVALAHKLLEGSDVLTTTVIGFPHGGATTKSKVFETEDAIDNGAVEVDMVMNIGHFLSGEYDFVQDEIAQVAAAAHKKGAILKVILETCYLTEEQIVKACELCHNAKADFVKTSTGYGTEGATTAGLKIMVENSNGMRVKAAGGVRTLDATLDMMAIGASRCGTSSSKAILEEAKERSVDGKLYVEC